MANWGTVFLNRYMRRLWRSLSGKWDYGANVRRFLRPGFADTKLGEFKADMVIEDEVLLELKATRAIERSHEAQLLNYLRCSQIEIRLVLNFGPHPQFRRLAFDNQSKKPLVFAELSRVMEATSNLSADKFPKKSAKSAAGF